VQDKQRCTKIKQDPKGGTIPRNEKRADNCIGNVAKSWKTPNTALNTVEGITEQRNEPEQARERKKPVVMPVLALGWGTGAEAVEFEWERAGGAAWSSASRSRAQRRATMSYAFWRLLDAHLAGSFGGLEAALAGATDQERREFLIASCCSLCGWRSRSNRWSMGMWLNPATGFLIPPARPRLVAMSCGLAGAPCRRDQREKLALSQ